MNQLLSSIAYEEPSIFLPETRESGRWTAAEVGGLLENYGSGEIPGGGLVAALKQKD